jgi:hypothetical protein
MLLPKMHLFLTVVFIWLHGILINGMREKTGDREKKI